jgi:hypothetical protein
VSEPARNLQGVVSTIPNAVVPFTPVVSSSPAIKESVIDLANSSISSGDGWYRDSASYILTGKSSNLSIIGKSNSNNIVISPGADIVLTLSGVSLISNKGPAIDLGLDSKVKIVLDGQNEFGVVESNTSAVIDTSGASLIISAVSDTASLKVKSSSRGQGAAIGGGSAEEWGNITIESGNIEAVGGLYSAGLGGGLNSKKGSIVVQSGSLIARGGEYASAIGSGNKGIGGSIVIRGGSISAFGGKGLPDIGGTSSVVAKPLGTILIDGSEAKVVLNAGGVGGSSYNKPSILNGVVSGAGSGSLAGIYQTLKPAITSTSVKTVIGGIKTTHQFLAKTSEISGAITTPVVWDLDFNADWISFDRSTGVLTVLEAAEAGTYELLVKASNVSGTAEQLFKLSIVKPVSTTKTVLKQTTLVR